jgi:hypothetical protein
MDVLRIQIEFYGCPLLLTGLLGVVFAFAIDYVLPLPVRWPYLLYRLDDRALRRHIHSIPPQYYGIINGLGHTEQALGV